MVWQTEEQNVLLHCVRCGTHFSGELVAPFSDYAVAGKLHGISSSLSEALHVTRRFANPPVNVRCLRPMAPSRGGQVIGLCSKVIKGCCSTWASWPGQIQRRLRSTFLQRWRVWRRSSKAR